MARPPSFQHRLRRLASATAIGIVLVMAPPIGAAVAAPTPAGTIVNFAGSPDGIAGYRGDGGPATSALLGSPEGMAVDSAGNVYIADGFTGHVRKVDPSGNISNFAGNSPNRAIGNSGDGGPATSAGFNGPTGVAVDSVGNVYIVDKGNARVRKVDRNGIITNFAGSVNSTGNSGDGGPATSATFKVPNGVAVDPAGNVYISDAFYNRVRKVDTNGIITNFAGSADGTPGVVGDGVPATTPSLDYPLAVATDQVGNVYISDTNSRVHKVDSRGIITTIAGNAAHPGFSGDGGPATAASLQVPTGVTVDLAGNVYISDSNARVRKVDAAGIITTFAGQGFSAEGDNVGDGGPATAATLGFPQGVAVDEAGNVYISDGTTSRVREVLSGNVMTGASHATFTVGVSGAITVKTNFLAAISEAGSLPAGVTFNTVTGKLSGTPAPGTAGAYPITFNAAGGSGVLHFILTVDQATLIYPSDGLNNVDIARPFTWAPIPEAQGYYLIAGTTLYGTGLVNSGVLPAAQTSFNGAARPAGTTLHATLYAEVNGTWSSYQAITFTTAAGPGALSFPANNQANVDPTRPFSWTPAAYAQGYYLIVGTTGYGSDLVNSGVLSATKSSYPTPILPAGRTLYATLYSAINGGWQFQSITFTTGPAAAQFTFPVNGRIAVLTPVTLSWSTVSQAQGYYLTVGTTAFGANLVNSGVLPAAQSSLVVPSLPKGTTIYATVFTALNGTWTGAQSVTFTTA
jgi:Putative Ig domain/NHL repeat